MGVRGELHSLAGNGVVFFILRTSYWHCIGPPTPRKDSIISLVPEAARSLAGRGSVWLMLEPPCATQTSFKCYLSFFPL